MSLKDRFTNLSALQKFIRRNYNINAMDVAVKIYEMSPNMLIDRLYIIMFEDIGLANVPLIKKISHILLDEPLKFKSIVKAMARSYKSRLCSYLAYAFRNVFTYDESDLVYKNIEVKYEPTPIKQYEMIDFYNDNFNINEAIKIAGAMFNKGMDSQFWGLINDEIDKKSDIIFINDLEKISQNMNDHGGRGTPMVWIFALIWKYLLVIGYDFPKNFDNTIEKGDIIGKFPNWVYDSHTSVGAKMGRDVDHFFEEGIKVNKLQELNIKNISEEDLKNEIWKRKKLNTEKFKIQRSNSCCKSSNYLYITNLNDAYSIGQIGLGENLYLPKYTVDELIDINDKSKINIHLSDLGTIQLPYVNKVGSRPYVLYCWLANNTDKQLRRYVLKLYSSLQTATKASESDSLLNNTIYEYQYCHKSNVICINELITQAPTVENLHGNVVGKKTYYTISLALPYFMPVTVGLLAWKKTIVAKHVIIINILKYIYDISDRTARNCGIYLVSSGDQIKLRVCSFDHSPGTDKKEAIHKLGNIDPGLLLEQKEWLTGLSEKIDKKYYIKITEIISSI